jgi:ribosomal protein L37AE/L43A
VPHELGAFNSLSKTTKQFLSLDSKTVAQSSLNKESREEMTCPVCQTILLGAVDDKGNTVYECYNCTTKVITFITQTAFEQRRAMAMALQRQRAIAQ